MTVNNSFSFLRAAGVTLAGAASLVVLSSCGEDEDQQKPETPAAAPAKPAPAVSTAARDALFEDLLYGTGKALIDGMTDPVFTCGVPAPECWDKVCAYKELLENYYNELAQQAPGSLQLARLSTRHAQVCSSLMSPKAMEAFETALKDYNAMGDADKASPAGKKILCDIETGMGGLLMGQNKAEDAFPHVQKALDLRKEILFGLVPQDQIPQISGALEDNVAEAASELIQAYNVMALCRLRIEDPDGAKKAITECTDLIKTFPLTSSRMALRYARIVATMGDIDRIGKDKEAALRSWYSAAAIFENLFNQHKAAAQSGNVVSAGYAIEAQNRHAQVSKAVKLVREELEEEEKEASGEAAPAETPAEPQEEPTLAADPEPAAAPAPEPAPAAAPAPAQPAKSNNKRNNRRR